MVNDGTVSRLDVATIIRNDDNDEAPILGIYDHAFAQELKPYIDRLEAANGLIECPQAQRLSLEMKKENKESAGLYDSEAYRVLSYRANVVSCLTSLTLLWLGIENKFSLLSLCATFRFQDSGYDYD